MAKFWYDCRGRARGLPPEWIGTPPAQMAVEVQGQVATLQDSRVTETSARGVQLIASATQIEALLKFRTLRQPTTNYQLGGPGLAFRVVDSDNFVEVTTGSGTAHTLGNVRERLVGNSDDNQVPDLYSGDPYAWRYLRVRAQGTSVKVRGWSEGNSEPSTWQLEHVLEASTVAGSVALVLPYAQGGCYQLEYLAIGTEGDTSPPEALASVNGVVVDEKNAPALRKVRAHRRDTGELVAEQMTNAVTGAYAFKLDPNLEYTLVLVDSDGGLLENDYAERIQVWP